MTSLAPALAPLPAAAAEPPAVTVTPAAALVDGQVVRVAWTGFPANSAVLVRQCSGTATGPQDCASALTNGGTRADGTGSASFQVVVGKLEEKFTCDFRTACRIGVFADTGNASPSPEPAADSAASPPATRPVLGAVADIAFAFPPDACPAATGEAVTASGASAPTRAITVWQGTLCRGTPSVSFDYTAKNSVDGARDLVAGLRDTAVTAEAFPEEDATALRAAGRPVAYAPLTLSGLVLAYRLQDRVSGEQITDLKLTPALAAQILTGQILQWNDKRIRDLNPGHAFPVSVRAVARADSSATTRQLTGWLLATAKADYEAGGPAYARAGITDTYPSTGDVDLRTGARSVALQVARPSQDTDPASFGYIGVMDSSTADLFGLDVARLANTSGAYVVPDAASLGEALRSAKKGPGGVLLPDPKAGGTAYPLPVVGYLAAPTRGLTPGQVTVVQALLDHAAGPGQKELPGGYVGLPADLVAANKAVRASVKSGLDVPATPPAAPVTTPDPGTGPGSGDGPVPAGPGPVDGGSLPDFSEPLPVPPLGPSGLDGVLGGGLDPGVVAGEGTADVGPLPDPGPQAPTQVSEIPVAAPVAPVVLSSVVRVPLVAPSSRADLLLPGVAALGLLALILGPAMQWAAVRGGRPGAL